MPMAVSQILIVTEFSIYQEPNGVGVSTDTNREGISFIVDHDDGVLMLM